MTRYEFKVIPAPKKPRRAKGVRSTEGRFAHALMAVMNELGTDGWDYVRSDTLPVETRSGLTGKSSEYQSVLVFRRVIAEAEEATAEVSEPNLTAVMAPAQEEPVAEEDPENSESEEEQASDEVDEQNSGSAAP